MHPGKPDFNAPLDEHTLAAAYQSAILNLLPSVDIDTDSDNDGVVEPDNETEDAMEDDDVNNFGKRIFINTDDDNEDGVPDVSNLKHTSYKTYNKTDNDFAEIKLRLTGGDVADLAGYELWLAQPNGLSLYATEDKKWIVPDPNDPDDDGIRNYDIPTKVATSGGGVWYKWTLGPGADFADTVYAEGKATGTRDVFWRLVDAGTGNILARDTVNVKVEMIVWPFSIQGNADWNDRPTTDWDGLALGSAWYIDKALIDYIKTPSEKGTIETIHPDLDDPNTAGTQLTWSSKVGSPSTTRQSYPNGFTMEFDYTFERSRGDGVHGYVKIDPEKDGVPRQKLSFVGNSGVKFGNTSADKPVEAQIIDVYAMVENAGGVNAFDPGQGGEVDGSGNVDTIQPFEVEAVSTLMTAIRYDGDYTKMLADNPVLPGSPDTAKEFYDTLKSNYDRHASNNQMKVEVTRLDPQQTTYTLEIYQGLTLVYSEDIALTTSIGKLDLQSHWGSGVIFSDMNIGAK